MVQKAIQCMIDGQLTPHSIGDAAIIAAFEAVNREDFMPSHYAKVAHLDGGHAVAQGRFTLPPMIIAKLLQLARIQKTDNVMMIGCATGYSASVCAQLASHVYAVEENQELATVARSIISQKDITGVDIVSTPLIAGCAEHAPYDAIIIEGAVETIPEDLFDQLADGGCMVFIKHSGVHALGVKGIGYLSQCVKHGNRYEIIEGDSCSAFVLPGFSSNTEFAL